jgi:FkbM family methyltransferase
MFKAFKFRSMAKDAPFVPWTRPYDGIACAEDIFFCFRLLLGRHPPPEEWIGHSSRIGEELAPVVVSYLKSLEFTRRGLLLQYRHPDQIALVERENFKIFSYKDDPAIGGDAYEPEVQAIFRRFLKPGMSVLDVGAILGFHTMHAASIVGPSGYVLAVEPSVKNVRLLEASRRHNGFDWVNVVQVAAGRKVSILALNADSKGTTSQIPEDLATLMGAETVTSVPLDILIPLERKIDFIKVDIEGAEYNALVGLQQTIQRCRPIIVSAFTPGFMPAISGVKGIEYLHWFIERDYRLGVIEKDGTIFEAFEDCELVMAKLRARDTDRIDIIAQPQLRR